MSSYIDSYSTILQDTQDIKETNHPEKLDKATSFDYMLCISSVMYHFSGTDQTGDQTSISNLILSMIIEQPENNTKKTNSFDEIGNTCLYSLFDVRCRSTLEKLFPSVIASLIFTCLPCQRDRIPFADLDDPSTLLFSTVMNGYKIVSNYERYYFAHLIEVELLSLQNTKETANNNIRGYISISVIIALIGLEVLKPLGKKRIDALISISKRSAKYYSSKFYRRIIISSIGIANEDLFKFCRKFYHPLSTVFKCEMLYNEWES
jgi:hypothetical protein